MIREILTLVVDKIQVVYYIEFEKSRRVFKFQPTLKNKTAPTFSVHVHSGEMILDPLIEESVAKQAREKVEEILGNSIFDQI